MQKQTVGERYEQQQIMKGKLQQQVERNQQPMATMKLQKEFKKLEEALGKANQSISQLNMTGSIAIELEDANQSIQFAITQLQALKLTFSEVLLTLPRGTQQQVNQLSQQISQASQTLQLIQASIPALLP